MPEKTDNELTSCDFERKIDELQKIVEKLEGGGVSLEQSMTLFESGLELTKQCVSDLNGMQERIDELNGQLDIILQHPLFGGGDE